MKKLLLLFALLIFVNGFCQNEKIEVEITHKQKNPYSTYVERDTYIDYGQIADEFNRELNTIVQNRQERKNQLKGISDNIIKFVNNEIKLVGSNAVNHMIIQLKTHFNEAIPFLHKLLTNGIYKVDEWETFMLDIPSVIVKDLLQLQSLDFKLADLKQVLFDKNGNSSSDLIEEITLNILSQYKPQIRDNGIHPELSKKNKVKKRGKPQNPSIVYISNSKDFNLVDIVNRVTDSISKTTSLTKIKKKNFETIYSELKKLKELFDLGIINKNEYDKKSSVLKKILLEN